MSQIFNSLFRPHDRPVYCRECNRGAIRKVSLHFGQYEATLCNDGESLCKPVKGSAYWLAECKEGHTVRQPIDFNVRYILEHPDDFLQPGDPRYAKVYPVQYARMKADEAQDKIDLEESYMATEIADKRMGEVFGRQGKEALALLKEKHPEFYKVKPKAQFKSKKTGLKPRVLGGTDDIGRHSR
jgi:hypothetical protein